MALLIDRDAMCVRYRHQHHNVLLNMMTIEFTDTAVVCMGDENEPGAYSMFTDYELKMLYLNMCGEKYTGYSRDILIKAVIGLVQGLPMSDLNGFELSIQAGLVPLHCTDFFKHVRGSNRPLRVPEKYTPPALTTVPGYVPAPITTPAPQSAPAAHTQAAAVHNTPRAPSGAPVPAEAPKTGSKTGRVWEIAEHQYRQQCEENEKFGRVLDVKSLRKDIIALCEAEGINSSTASVQYGKWRGTKGF